MQVQPGTRFGDYVVDGSLGEGGLAQVFRAHAPDGSQVALKVLTPELRADQPGASDRLRREASVLEALRPIPYVVQLIDSFREPGDGADVLVMELIEGRSLLDHIGRSEDTDRVLEWMGHACHALHDIHQAGFVHRDIKPDNLMVVDDGAVPLRIIDFNSAGSAGPIAGRLTRVQGTFPFTPAYLAPECFDGVPPDASADVYALAMTFGELLLGHHPLVRPGATEPVTNSGWQELHETVPFPDLADAGVMPELSRVLQHAAARDRDDRIPDAAVLWARLRDVWDARSTASSSESVPEASAPASSSSRGAVGLGMVLAAAVLLFGVLGAGWYGWSLYDAARRQAAQAQEDLRLQRQAAERAEAELARLAAQAPVPSANPPAPERPSPEPPPPPVPAEPAAPAPPSPQPAPSPVEKPRPVAAPRPVPPPAPPPPTIQVRISGNRVVMPPIRFMSGRGTLRSESEPVLAAVAAAIKLDGRVASIGVHSDSQGSDEANLRLTESRAKAVRNFLQSHGVPASKLEAKGYGETLPIAPNTTSQGRAQNRRVEITLR